jgi:hypothetical protein
VVARAKRLAMASLVENIFAALGLADEDMRSDGGGGDACV